MKTALNVAITGAAGQIGYALVVSPGALFGPDQPVNLHSEITRIRSCRAS